MEQVEGGSAGQAEGNGGQPNAKPFEYEAHVRFSEVDHQGLMTLPALINAFQDCSTFQSEMLGVGIDWLKHEQKAWVLSHWHIVIDRLPALCEPVRVGTFATRFKGITANRNFYLRDAAGALIARANSTWAFMDLVKGRPVRAEAKHIEPYGEHEPLDMPAEPRKIAVPDMLQDCEPVPVRRHHIDMNEHVNNCQYVQIALELLPRETTAQCVRVDYKRPATLGDTIFPKLAQEEGRTVVALCDEQDSPYAVVELS